jgi:hypothetical protein
MLQRITVSSDVVEMSEPSSSDLAEGKGSSRGFKGWPLTNSSSLLNSRCRTTATLLVLELLDYGSAYTLHQPLTSAHRSSNSSLTLASLVRMARNEEKSQSMLFRFREAQAAELGLSGRSDRRPRVASSCKDLRQCERWRGEILREISRKVSKIQDGASATSFLG